MLDWHFSISGTRNRNQEYQIQHTLLKKMAEKRAVKQSLTWMADNIKYYSM